MSRTPIAREFDVMTETRALDQETISKGQPPVSSAHATPRRFGWFVPATLVIIAVAFGSVALFWAMSKESSLRYVTQMVTRGPIVRIDGERHDQSCHHRASRLICFGRELCLNLGDGLMVRRRLGLEGRSG
jgi:hypothetical protein